MSKVNWNAYWGENGSLHVWSHNGREKLNS